MIVLSSRSGFAMARCAAIHVAFNVASPGPGKLASPYGDIESVTACADTRAGVVPHPRDTPVAGAEGSPTVSQMRPKKPVGCGDCPFVSPDHHRRIISKCDSLGFTPPTPSTTAIG